MRIQSTIETSTVVFRPSMKRVGDIGGTSNFGGRGGYSGTIIGALVLTVLNSILTLARRARVGSPDPWAVRRI